MPRSLRRRRGSGRGGKQEAPNNGAGAFVDNVAFSVRGEAVMVWFSCSSFRNGPR
jgi:hypothetical protein